MTVQQLAISGYYGFGNTGDEAVLAGILAGLRRVAPTVVPVVLTADPNGTADLHCVAAAQREHIGTVWHTLRKSRALLSGGGSLLQDITSKRSIYYYLGTMGMARILHRPFCIYAQGIGPINAASAKRSTSYMLRASRGIWVRDWASHQLVETLLSSGRSHKKPPLNMAGDAAFLLPAPDTNRAKNTVRQIAATAQHAPETPVWLVALRPWGGNQWEPQLVAGVALAAKEAQATLLFVGMHPDMDQSQAETLCKQVVDLGVAACVAQPHNMHTVRELLAGADLVIAMRLHALILAAAAGVPGVALSYDPKVTALAQELPLPLLSVQQLSETKGFELLRNLVAQAWNQRAQASVHLCQVASERRLTALNALADAVRSLGLPAQNVPARCGCTSVSCEHAAKES